MVQSRQPPTTAPKELTQLEILAAFMNKRLQTFKEKCTKQAGKGAAGDFKTAQHKILRDLLAQIAIVCGVCGPP